MYKIKTTCRDIKERANNVRSCGYCDLSTLLKYHEPIAYTSGVYGWNFDVYDVYGITICTGYRGMVGERLINISEYEKQARTIDENYSVSWEERKSAIDKLLKEFCNLNK